MKFTIGILSMGVVLFFSAVALQSNLVGFTSLVLLAIGMVSFLIPTWNHLNNNSEPFANPHGSSSLITGEDMVMHTHQNLQNRFDWQADPPGWIYHVDACGDFSICLDAQAIVISG